MGIFKRFFKDDSLCGRVEAGLRETFPDMKWWKVSSGPMTKAEIAEYHLGSCQLRVTQTYAEGTYTVEIRTWPKPEHPEAEIDPGLVFWPLEALMDPSEEECDEAADISAQLAQLRAASLEVLNSDDPAKLFRSMYERSIPDPKAAPAE